MAEHREEEPSHRLIFRNKKSHCKRETATEVRISGNTYSKDIYLPWPESAELVENMQLVIRGAFEAGRQDAQLDIRLALGIKDTVDEDSYYD